MGGKADAPPSPNYQAAAQQQAVASQQAIAQQIAANRPQTYTPWGVSTWSPQQQFDPTTNQYVTNWTNQVTLSPQEQQALNSQQALQAGLSGQAQNYLGAVQNAPAMNWASFQAAGQTPTAQTLTPASFAGAPGVQAPQLLNQQVTQQLYGAATANLDPQWAQAENQLHSQLINQGISYGTKPYQDQMAAFQRQKAAAYGQAQAQATSGGIQAAQGLFGEQQGARQQFIDEMLKQFGMQQAAGQQTFGQQQSIAAYQNQLRQQQIQEAAYRQQQPLEYLNALLRGQQVGMPQFPSFAQAAAAQPANLLGAAQAQFGAAADIYNLQAAQQAAPFQMAAGLAGAYLGGPAGAAATRGLFGLGGGGGGGGYDFGL